MTCHIWQDLLPPFLRGLAICRVVSLPHECLTLHRQKQKFASLILQSHLKIKELLNFGRPFTIIIAIGTWNLCTLGTRVKSSTVSFGEWSDLTHPWNPSWYIYWSKSFIESMSFNNFLSPSIQTSKSLFAVETAIGVH